MCQTLGQDWGPSSNHRDRSWGTSSAFGCRLWLTSLHIGFKGHVDIKANNDSLSLAQQRPCHLHRQLPACYRDFVPEPPRPLPPLEVQKNTDSSNLSGPLHASPPTCPLIDVPLLPSHPKIKTQINNFGLFWLYNEDLLPTNDPDMDNWLDEAGLSALWQGNSNWPNEKATNPFCP